MPLATQSKLLRVIEDRRVRPVGSEREVPVDLRFVFATNADLQKEVERGRFRADLFYRINVMQLTLPPLRDRGNDVQELADLFMQKLSQQLGMPQVPIDAPVRAALKRYAWPGNVRELRNLIERSLILGKFPDDFRGKPPVQAGPSGETLDDIERRHILAVLEETGGNRDEAARRLGISRKTIDRKCAVWNG
jgi:transcriptional regulator with PAS, ATPase and Fis domain